MVIFLKSHARREEEEREKDGIRDYFKILPLEITLDILTRLPTESVLDCKSVCTNWRSVVRHPSFSKMHSHHHLNHPAAESGKLGFLALIYDSVDINPKFYYFEYNENHDQSTTTMVQRITRFDFTSPVRSFDFVGSVNGLICFLDNHEGSVCICNLITREYVILPNINIGCDTGNYKYKYEETSFGYVSSTDEYKVVEFYRSTTHVEVHVYTLGSGDGWRNLGEFDKGPRSLFFQRKVFFADGALYWMDDKLDMIGTFDLAEEKFGDYLSPPDLPPNDVRFAYEIGVLDGVLFLAVDEGDGFNDIWLLKKRDEPQSLVWNEEFTIKTIDLLAVTKSDGIFTYTGNYLNIHDTETLTWKSLVKFRDRIAQVSPHRNTLVSLKDIGEEDIKIMESAKIEKTKSLEQLHEDAEAEYMYL